jgi:site-specific DNA-methyltransferase (adenine-specific)
LRLLGLRKAGRLAALGTARRTELSWEALDPFLFASEIALRRMLDLGFPSLDHVLSDPAAVVRFDELARGLAPGFSSLEYRWAALRLRKAARVWRRFADRAGLPALPKNWKEIRLDEPGLAGLPPTAGVYVLAEGRADARPAYIGETWNLQDRAARTFRGRPALDLVRPNSGEWALRWFELKSTKAGERRGFQSRLIAANRPPMNYLELGAPHA